jgi:hypothetical protein
MLHAKQAHRRYKKMDCIATIEAMIKVVSAFSL